MGQGTPRLSSLGRSLALLEAIVSDRESRGVTAIAAGIGLPRATAHRQIATLIDEAFLRRLPGGQLFAGSRLLRLAQMLDEKQIAVVAAGPVLRRLATKMRCVLQLGTLENDMVTYRLKTGKGAGDLFTKVSLQLEAYCTGIGKVLLAHLSDVERETYLANGPFPALTPRTITRPEALRAELETIRQNGFACDDEEIAVGLRCLAVPIVTTERRIIAAISASFIEERMMNADVLQHRLSLLRDGVAEMLHNMGLAGAVRSDAPPAM